MKKMLLAGLVVGVLGGTNIYGMEAKKVSVSSVVENPQPDEIIKATFTVKTYTAKYTDKQLPEDFWSRSDVQKFKGSKTFKDAIKILEKDFEAQLKKPIKKARLVREFDAVLKNVHTQLHKLLDVQYTKVIFSISLHDGESITREMEVNNGVSATRSRAHPQPEEVSKVMMSISTHTTGFCSQKIPKDFWEKRLTLKAKFTDCATWDHIAVKIKNELQASLQRAEEDKKPRTKEKHNQFIDAANAQIMELFEEEYNALSLQIFRKDGSSTVMTRKRQTVKSSTQYSARDIPAVDDCDLTEESISEAMQHLSVDSEGSDEKTQEKTRELLPVFIVISDMRESLKELARNAGNKKSPWKDRAQTIVEGLLSFARDEKIQDEKGAAIDSIEDVIAKNTVFTKVVITINNLRLMVIKINSYAQDSDSPLHEDKDAKDLIQGFEFFGTSVMGKPKKIGEITENNEVFLPIFATMVNKEKNDKKTHHKYAKRILGLYKKLAAQVVELESVAEAEENSENDASGEEQDFHDCHESDNENENESEND